MKVKVKVTKKIPHLGTLSIYKHKIYGNATCKEIFKVQCAQPRNKYYVPTVLPHYMMNITKENQQRIVFASGHGRGRGRGRGRGCGREW